MKYTALPPQAYRWLAALSLAIAGLLTYLTIRYFVHGAEALETDPTLKTLAFVSVLVLVGSEVVAAFMAATLSGQKLAAWCMTMRGYALTVFAIEFFMVCAVMLSSTLGADMTQTKISNQEASLKARIAQIESRATLKLQTAERQRATARDAYELKLAARSSREATAESALADPLHNELKALQAQQAPTFISSISEAGKTIGWDIGKAFAISLVIARCFALSAGAPLFAGISGVLWRLGGAPAGTAAKPATFGSPAPAPVPLGKTPSPAPAKPAKQSWLARMADSLKKPGWKQAALVPAAAGSAAGASAQPPTLPEPPSISVRYEFKAQEAPELSLQSKAAAAPEPTPTSASAPSESRQAGTVPESAQKAPPAKPATVPVSAQSTVPESAQSSAPEQAQSQAQPEADTPAPAPKKKRTRTPAATAVADGAKLDTGTEGKAAARYQRIKAAVQAGKLKPSVRAIQGTEGGSTLIARRYLQQLHAEGVIERQGQGWARASSHAHQMSLV